MRRPQIYMRNIPPSSSTGVRLLDPLRSCSEAGSWRTGQEIGISVGSSLAVLEGVVERGENVEPPLDAGIVVYHFPNALERLVIKKDAKIRAPKVASKTFDDPNNAASFQVERGPVPLGIEVSAAYIRDGPH